MALRLWLLATLGLSPAGSTTAGLYVQGRPAGGTQELVNAELWGGFGGPEHPKRETQSEEGPDKALKMSSEYQKRFLLTVH